MKEEMPAWFDLINDELKDSVNSFRAGAVLSDQRFLSYKERLVDHVTFVIEAGRKIGVCDEQLLIHDRSKITPIEFLGYALHFPERNAPGYFADAWLHHIHNNKHHWQHWIFPDNYKPKGAITVVNGIVTMPIKYVDEMIADWMGASMAYTGSWDMTSWLVANMPRIRLNPRSATHAYEVLIEQGYQEVVAEYRFKTD